MTSWRCYYHFVWATKHRQPLITESLEKVIYGIVINKSGELKCHVFAVNGIADHIHIAVSIPPVLAAATWAKNIKGTTSYTVNLRLPETSERFQWQIGYSVLTFGAKHLGFVVHYIQNQKIHHAANQLEPYLEAIPTEDHDRE